MPDCIRVCGIQFWHQFLLTDKEDERRCHFCQLTFASTAELEKAREQDHAERSKGEGI
jgi:hypothetical protein